MKYLQTVLLILLLLGCDNKQTTIEYTISDYYEKMLQGEMEKSQELLEWNPQEADVIDYYANMSTLRKEYRIVSVGNFEITSLSKVNGRGQADVKITYKNKNGDEIIEINKIKLRLDSKGIWKITSIIRDMTMGN